MKQVLSRCKKRVQAYCKDVYDSISCDSAVVACEEATTAFFQSESGFFFHLSADVSLMNRGIQDLTLTTQIGRGMLRTYIRAIGTVRLQNASTDNPEISACYPEMK